MPIKLTTEEFISKAKAVHGDRYDYSKVVYINNHTKVIIICPIHGEFKQRPNAHVSHKQNCPVCNNMTLDKFILRAKDVHGDRYDYSKVEFKTSHDKVIIICPIHGEFKQRVFSHIINGQGCVKCVNRKLTTEEFISKAKAVHGDRYDYSKAEYNGMRNSIVIVCPIHGEFKQTSSYHTSGNGCIKCFNDRRKHSIDEVRSKLSIEEDPMKIDDDIYCKCSFCQNYFIPTSSQITYRVRALRGTVSGDGRMYCSDECKEKCPIYGQISYPKGYLPDYSREIQPELRDMVISRDDYQCQKCGSTKDIHCHHITGVEINPIESADVDNCITLCKECHKVIHLERGCTYHEMKRKAC